MSRIDIPYLLLPCGLVLRTDEIQAVSRVDMDVTMRNGQKYNIDQENYDALVKMLERL